MPTAPFESNGHQVTKTRNTAHNQAAHGERLHICRIGPKPIPPCSRKSVGRAFALS